MSLLESFSVYSKNWIVMNVVVDLGVGLEGVSSSGGSSTPASISARSSNASANSVEFASRDTDESSSIDSQRHSLQSVDSNQVRSHFS